jgi:hypothetical protein
MAASSNKVTAVHFALIFFVMVTILLGVCTYLFLKEGSELRAELAKEKADAGNLRTTSVRYAEQLTTLKNLLGHTQPDVGDPATPNTVAHALNEQLKLTGAQLQPGIENTVNAHLTALRAKADSLTKDVTAERLNLQTLQTQLQSLRNQYSQEVAIHEQAATAANRDLQSRVTQQEEIVQARESEIQRLQNEYAAVSQELDQTKANFAAFQAESKQSHENLVRINNQLREKYESATRLSFEVADGEVRWVDNSTEVVYINLGAADHLPLRTTFSVYRKNNQGVGRGPEDIKGAIEVTRIIDDHLAEARITDQDYLSPIAVGDPIYSPLWEVGRRERFAFVGLIDLDGDGESDRDLLHQVVNAAGGEIQHEVDDQGQRTPGKIDDTTKFLVIGNVPDPNSLSDQKEIAAAIEIGKQHQAMRDEAREQGVRTITLHDFLNYMGYKPRRRVWRPGDERPYSLTAGSRSTAVGENVGQSRVGTGQTSGLYGNTSRLKPPSSNGDTNGGRQP